jgi:uncharacterized repeat protein (TIGR03837 family)
VIDNLGDAGVCWRLASLLAREPQDTITLWIDQADVLQSLAPPHSRPTNVTIRIWQPGVDDSARIEKGDEPDVLIETFGCRTPIQYQSDIFILCSQLTWINLEYLSAEPYVARSHGLPSPVMSGPAKGMRQWFFYPGFTQGTGGVMWVDAQLAASLEPPHPCPLPQGEREKQAYIFCYESPSLQTLCRALLEQGITPHIAPGRGAAYARSQFEASLKAQCQFAPLVAQADFDAQLAGNALNVVRGEDSFVRAQLAARPFIWHIYPQDDHVHREKLSSFFELYSSELPDLLKQVLWRVWQGFNEGTLATQDIKDFMENLPAYTSHAAAWRAKLIQQNDLVTQLRAFVKAKAEKS